MSSAGWETISDPQPFPLRNEGSALVFDFPSSGSMHYLFAPSTQAALRGTLTVTLHVTTTGAVVFDPLDTTSCNQSPSARPLL